MATDAPCRWHREPSPIFYGEVMATLRDMAPPVTIWPMPVEIANPVRLSEDTVRRSYDPLFVDRFWRILVNIQQTLTATRCGFIGKCSPVHFFWAASIWR